MATTEPTRTSLVTRASTGSSTFATSLDTVDSIRKPDHRVGRHDQLLERLLRRRRRLRRHSVTGPRHRAAESGASGDPEPVARRAHRLPPAAGLRQQPRRFPGPVARPRLPAMRSAGRGEAGRPGSLATWALRLAATGGAAEAGVAGRSALPRRCRRPAAPGGRLDRLRHRLPRPPPRTAAGCGRNARYAPNPAAVMQSTTATPNPTILFMVVSRTLVRIRSKSRARVRPATRSGQ